jgi:teichuronic acid exporter
MPNENSVKQALRWMLFGKGITQTVSWIITLVVIRILTPADYGLLAMAMILIIAAQMLREMGLQQALVQAKELSNHSIRQVFTALQLINWGIFIGLYLSAPFAAVAFNEPQLVNITRVLALQFPILAFQSVPSAMLSRKMNFKNLAMINASGAVINSFVTLALAILDFGVWAIILGNLVGAAARTFQFARIEKIAYLPTLNFQGFRNLFSFGGLIMASTLLQYIQMRTADMLIGKILGKEALGIYNVSNRLGTLPMQKISGILNGVGIAAFSKIQHDEHKVRENYLKMQSILAFFSFPVFWGIASMTDSLVTVVLGERWTAAIVPLQVIALAAPLRMIFNMTTPALNGTGKPQVVFTNLLFSAFTMPIAYYVGIHWGVNGVANVWIFYYPFLFVFMHRRSLVALGIPFRTFIEAIARSVLIAMSMLLFALTINAYAETAGVSPLARLLIVLTFGICYYALVSIWLNAKVFDISRKLII